MMTRHVMNQFDILMGRYYLILMVLVRNMVIEMG